MYATAKSRIQIYYTQYYTYTNRNNLLFAYYRIFSQTSRAIYAIMHTTHLLAQFASIFSHDTRGVIMLSRQRISRQRLSEIIIYYHKSYWNLYHRQLCWIQNFRYHCLIGLGQRLGFKRGLHLFKVVFYFFFLSI